MTDERSSSTMDWYLDDEAQRYSPRKRPKYDDRDDDLDSMDDFFAVNAHSVRAEKGDGRMPQLECRLSIVEDRLAKIEAASADQGANTW